MWSSQVSAALEVEPTRLNTTQTSSGGRPFQKARPDSDPVIRVMGLSKFYTIYDRPQDRLKQFIFPRLQRLVGRNPCSYYREFWALRDVSFEVRRGETFGIIGRNGAGKSTLLQILSGTLHPSAGTVEIRGRVGALLELGSGFNVEFSGRENVCVYASVLGLSREEIEERLPRILEFAEIGGFIDMPIKTYSSGMVMRLAFSVIAHVDADILIIDEALSVGDAFFVQKCLRFLRGFMEIGTILFVSHDTGAVNNLCQRAIWLQDGVRRAMGPPKQLTEAYLAEAYETRQGVSPPRTLQKKVASVEQEDEIETQDKRLAYLNNSQFRNDIELFRFNENGPSFGRGGISITNVQLQELSGRCLSWCLGGEIVVLCVQCNSHIEVVGPIVGFIVKDRLGQTLFGDNTYLTYSSTPIRVIAGQKFYASFKFRMPVLPVGDYSVCVAVAEGTQKEHVQHHWIHDAIIFKSHSSSVCTGLVGVPMREIELGVQEP